jgi:hypothetical protein
LQFYTIILTKRFGKTHLKYLNISISQYLNISMFLNAFLVERLSVRAACAFATLFVVEYGKSIEIGAESKTLFLSTLFWCKSSVGAAGVTDALVMNLNYYLGQTLAEKRAKESITLAF